MSTLCSQVPVVSTSPSESAQQDLWSRITGGKAQVPRSSPSKSLLNDTARVSSGSVVPRFAAAQYGRTIHHPRLQQPTPEQEKLHLSLLAACKKSAEADANHSASVVENGPLESKEEEAELVMKLSKALLGSSRSTRDLAKNNNCYEDMKYAEEEKMPSPTSTLCFPESHNNNSYNYGMPSFEPQSTDDDYFVGTCQFIDNEEEEEPHQSCKYQDFQEIYKNQDDCDSMQPNPFICRRGNANQVDNTPHNCCGGLEPHFPSHSFVICADTQLGVTSQNEEWETELEYTRKAVQVINSLDPPPLFVCVCGDLVDMEYTFEESKGYSARFKSKKECNEVQDRQNLDFQKVFSELDERIPLVCLCGNHDIGNRPTTSSIQRFKDFFGDEYLGFWANGTYNIVLNNVLFSNPTGSPHLFDQQLDWLEERLIYAHEHDAKMIFVYGHHPWFLYHEDEDVEELTGISPFPKEWSKSPIPSNNNEPPGFKDAYFAVPKKYRMMALELFKQYGVNAAFTGHFHQNVISKSSWGMDHIITSSLSVVFDSSGKPKQEEENGRGLRLVEVHLKSQDKKSRVGSSWRGGPATSRSVRNGGVITHRFIPID